MNRKFIFNRQNKIMANKISIAYHFGRFIVKIILIIYEFIVGQKVENPTYLYFLRKIKMINKNKEKL